MCLTSDAPGSTKYEMVTVLTVVTDIPTVFFQPHLLARELRSGVLECPFPCGNGQGDPRWLEKTGARDPQRRLVLGVNTKVRGRGCDRLAESMAGKSRAGWVGKGGPPVP